MSCGGGPARRFDYFFQAEDGIRDGTVTGVQTCALPIFCFDLAPRIASTLAGNPVNRQQGGIPRTNQEAVRSPWRSNYSLMEDRKSTRLNSSHSSISYAVFCLKKKNKQIN